MSSMMDTKARIAAAFGLMISADMCFGWGQEGHWLVGRIAELQAKDNTRKVINSLLSEDQDIPAQQICGSPTPAKPSTWKKPTSLAHIASFPDEIRTAPIGDGTSPFHFVNIEHDDPGTSFSWTSYCKSTFQARYSYDSNNKCYKTLASNPSNTKTVFSCSLFKTEDFFRTLAQKSSSTSDKLWALKFIVHIVGDAHQPLHNAVWNNDRGGNLRAVSFFNEPDPFYGPLNLHSIWDDNILERAMRKHIYNDESPRKLTPQDFEAYAQYLNSQIAKTQAFSQSTVQEWLTTGPSEWGWSALQKAVQFAYQGFSFNYKPIPSKDEPDQSVTRVTISQDYYNKALPVIDEQIMIGSIHLAHLLDQAFN